MAQLVQIVWVFVTQSYPLLHMSFKKLWRSPALQKRAGTWWCDYATKQNNNWLKSVQVHAGSDSRFGSSLATAPSEVIGRTRSSPS